MARNAEIDQIKEETEKAYEIVNRAPKGNVMADGLIHGKNGEKFDQHSFAVVGGENENIQVKKQ